MGTRHRLPVIAALLFLAIAGAGRAQTSSPPAPVTAPAAATGPAASPPPGELQKLQGQVSELQRVINDLIAQLAASRDYSAEQKAAINAAKVRALTSYYNSQASFNENGDHLRAYQQQVFAWQLMAGNWLLGVVVLLSVCGVVFAGYEMIASRRLVQNNLLATTTPANPQAAPGAAPAAAPPPAAPAATVPTGTTTLTIEPTKVQVTSAVIGIVILTLSLGFLYLFLRQVYAIDVIDLTDTGRSKVVSTHQPEQPAPDAKAAAAKPDK